MSRDKSLIAADVSVIIPAYNAVRTIHRALQSVAGQTLKPLEIIVVDDGSSDGTYEAAREFEERIDGCNVLVFRQDNAGAGAARNAAIMKSTGQYLAFLDSDDEWLPEKLEICMPEMVNDNRDFLCHNITFVSVIGEEILLDSHASFLRHENPYLACFLIGFIPTSTVIVRRDIVVRAGGFDPTLKSGQDYELWLSIFASGSINFDVLPNAIAKYYETPGGITSQIGVRTDCARRIVRDHAFELERFSKFPYGTLIKRSLIIEYQTISGYYKCDNKVSALGAFFMAPFRILRMCFIGRMPKMRPNFLSGTVII